jgi:hypothetical protein
MGRFPTLECWCRNFTKILRLLPTLYIYKVPLFLVVHSRNVSVSAGQEIPLYEPRCFLPRVKKQDLPFDPILLGPVRKIAKSNC